MSDGHRGWGRVDQGPALGHAGPAERHPSKGCISARPFDVDAGRFSNVFRERVADLAGAGGGQRHHAADLRDRWQDTETEP